MKPGGGLQGFAGALQDEDAAIVGEGVQHHGGVLARLHHLVQIANRPLAHGAGQGAVGPEGAVVADQMPPHQVRRGQVVVAGDGVEGPAQALGHVAHQSRLAAAGGALDHHRQAMVVGLLEEVHLPALRLIVDGGGVIAGRSGWAGSRGGAASVWEVHVEGEHLDPGVGVRGKAKGIRWSMGMPG